MNEEDAKRVGDDDVESHKALAVINVDAGPQQGSFRKAKVGLRNAKEKEDGGAAMGLHDTAYGGGIHLFMLSD